METAKQLDVVDVAFGGDGVARDGKMAVFIPFTVDGDRALVRMGGKHKKFARAVLQELVEPSPHRTAPRCPYFGQCGGCQYQHIVYEHQLELKHSQLLAALRRIGHLEVAAVPAVLPSARPYHYRNRILLHGPGQPGYIATNNRTRLVVDQCPLASEAINEELAKLRQRGLEVRGDLLLRETADEVLALDTAESVAGLTVRERVGSLELDVPVRGFHQVDSAMAAKLVEWLAGKLVGLGMKTLVDAYCGSGLFTFGLADTVASCRGIESHAPSVRAARANASRLDLPHCEFHDGRAEDMTAGVLEACDGDRTCLLLDPPRTGCDGRVLQAAIDNRPAGIAYVSCNPPVLARDLAVLCGGGYRVEAVQGFDVFPQTAHLEVITWLTRDSSGAGGA